MLHFFDLNEHAIAYHRHCLSKSRPISDTFMQTFNYIAQETIREGQRNHPDIDPAHIKTKMLERRYIIQSQLDQDNIRHGCDTPASRSAKAHYEEFSITSTETVKNYFENTQTAPAKDAEAKKEAQPFKRSAHN